MRDLKRCLLIVGLFAMQSVARTDAQIMGLLYQYTGGKFTIRTVFDFNTSIEADAIAGTTRLQPFVTITNSDTGRSITASYISEDIDGPQGRVLIGKEVNPGLRNPRTNTGTVVVDASSLGPGLLVFEIAENSELSSPAPASSRNVFGRPFYVWNIHPQSILPVFLHTHLHPSDRLPSADQ